MCIVLFRVLPVPPFPSFLPQATKNAEVPLPRPPGVWVTVSTTPAGPWDRKVSETRGAWAKKLVCVNDSSAGCRAPETRIDQFLQH